MSNLSLLCRVHHLVCALPLGDVIETLRPLPIEPLAGAPAYVCGLSIIRGVPVPVVDTGLLLGTEQARPTRFVTLRVGPRTVAIAVDAVLGVRALLAATGTAELPPLLRAVGNDVVSSLGSLDRELLLVLESGRLLPDELFARLTNEGSGGMSLTIGDREVESFRAGIARRLGLSFDETKSGQLAEVLRQRLEATGRSREQYLAQFEREVSREEIAALARSLTVGETYFFRNPDQFRATSELVLPERLRLRAGERRLRILSAGCSSGEEAYSLAILARGLLPDPHFELSIRAVDVNPAVLEKARLARFSSWSLRETPPEVQRRWFREDGRDLVLDEGIRSAVVFEARNLSLEDAELWQPGSYDLVFCRNMLMYFTPAGAQAVVERIAGALLPGGYLFLGHAETLRGVSQRFHLCHTHGTFYYQVKPNSAGLPRPALDALPTPARFDPLPLPLVDAADGWVDAIRKASERIDALSRGREGTLPPPEVARPGWDLALALELLQKERYKDALHLVRAFPPESARDPDVLLLQAVLLAHDAELAAAEETCHRLLGMDELNAGAHYVLALCREGAHDHRAALEHDQVAVYLAPAFAMPRLHLGLLARRHGDREAARRELGHALTLLQGEDPSRLLLFGGGFQREALVALCRAELTAVGGPR